jgi:Abnormal spindle-like microcephaly-assoc'd, ASPM-SPD-2-Hydin/NHL repeat
MKNCARLAVWALACLIFGSVSVHAQNITTVVGGGPVGLTPTAASVGSPVAVRSDSLGNAYVLDNALARVFKIDHTTGLISVFAGNGTTGFSGDGGPASSASMNQPSGMCVDSNNNIFVADSDNAVIRVIIGPGAVAPPSLTGPVTAGNIYTAVGIQTSTNPQFGGDSGPALSSHLHFPDGCAFDSHGNMYIADRGNNEVRVVIGAGNTTTNLPAGLTGPLTPGDIYLFAGALGGSFPTPPAGGYAANGSLALGGAIYGPFDVVVDSSNNVYIADLGNNFDQAGNPNTQMGQPNNNNVVREVLASNGTITTVAGVPQTYSTLSLTGTGAPVASGVATAVALNEPKGLSVDTSGNLYFCDTINQVIRKVSGGNISVVAGSLLQHGYSGDTNVATTATLTYPAGTFVDSTGDLFIADDSSNAVRIVPLLANDGSYLLNHIYTVYGNGHLNFGGDGAAASAGELNTPAGLAVDSASNIYIADGANSVVRKVTKTPSDLLSTIAGQPEATGFLNNPIYLNAALGVATDAAGNVYIADTANCLVRKVSSAGITTLAGVEPAVPVPDDSQNAPVCGLGTAPGIATATKIGNVNSVAVDSHGNVFFSDKTNSVIWEVPTVSSGTLVAGTAYIAVGSTAGFGGDGGVATSAKLSGPTGIYIDIYDNLFIADAGNHRIREVPAINVTTPTPMTAGSIYTIVGTGTSGSLGTGAATSAEIATPFAIVVDHAENVYFSDTTNQTIRKVTASTGNISIVAGTNTVAGFSGDGAAATSAQLNVPQGLALVPDSTPNTTSDLLISDSNNNRVRSVAALASNAAVALVSFSPNPAVFPAEPLGTASSPVAITLTNTGSAPLSVTGFSISGADAGDFAPGTNTCVSASPIAPNGTCTVNVVFTPTVLGSRTASIVVASSAFGSPSANLSGVGGTPQATLNPTTLTFASTTVGKAATTQTITLTNGGNAPTVILAGGIAINGANAGDFSENDTCVGLAGIAAGANCTITVGFKPTAAGSRTATLAVTSNVGTPATATLNGTGASATLTLTITDTDAGGPTQTVTAGATATYNLSVAGDQAVTATIACAGAPTDATCTPTPASVAVTPTTAGTLKLTVTTTARGQMVPFNQPSMKIQPPSFLQIAPMVSLALLFVIAMLMGLMQGQAGRARTLRLAMSLCLILMPIAAATVLVGCGGGSSSGGGSTPPPASTGTPAGTYTITVTATSGSTTSKALSLTLVVN